MKNAEKEKNDGNGLKEVYHDGLFLPVKITGLFGVIAVLIDYLESEISQYVLLATLIVMLVIAYIALVKNAIEDAREGRFLWERKSTSGSEIRKR